MPYSTRSPHVPQYRNSYGRTIADLIRQGGDIQAQQAYASGDAWGRGIAQAGAALGQGIQQFSAIKAEEKAAEEADAQRDAVMTGLAQSRQQMDPREWATEVYRQLPTDMADKYIKGIYGAEQAALDLVETRQAIEKGDQEMAAKARESFTSALGDVYHLADSMGGPTNPIVAGTLEREILPMAREMYGEELTLEQLQQPEVWQGLGQYLQGPQEEKADSRGFEARVADAAEAGDVEAFQTLLGAREQFAEAGRKPMDALDRRLKQLQIQREQLAVDAGKAPKTEDGEKPVKLGAAALDRVAGADQGIILAENLDKLVEERWLGPVLGRATEAGVGLPGVPVSEELAEFYADTATLKNATVKAITGAQMSEPEAERIMKQIPTFADKPVVWRKKLEQTVKNLRMMRSRIVTLASGDVTDPSLATDDPLGILGGGSGADPLGLIE